VLSSWADIARVDQLHMMNIKLRSECRASDQANLIWLLFCLLAAVIWTWYHHNLVSLTTLYDVSIFQSIQDRRFDSVSAVYLLLLDRWKRHHSEHKTSGSRDVLTHTATRTARRSSITTGKGQTTVNDYFWFVFLIFFCKFTRLNVMVFMSWVSIVGWRRDEVRLVVDFLCLQSVLCLSSVLWHCRWVTESESILSPQVSSRTSGGRNQRGTS